MGIPQRLARERQRLELTQIELATEIGTTKRSVVNWEGGASSPSASVLERYAQLGADVLYILTGQRSTPVAPQSLLPTGDRILLDNFHAAPAQVQAGIKTTLGAFAPEKGKAKGSKKGRAA